MVFGTQVKEDQTNDSLRCELKREKKEERESMGKHDWKFQRIKKRIEGKQQMMQRLPRTTKDEVARRYLAEDMRSSLLSYRRLPFLAQKE